MSGKNLVLKLQTKMLSTNQITGFFKLSCFKNYLRYNVHFLHVVRYPCKLQLNHVFAKFGQAFSAFSRITRRQYLWQGLSYFVYLLRVFAHPWKQQCYVVLIGYCLVCPKSSEITNCQYLWKGLSDFVDFLHVYICILLDIH